MEQRSVLLWSVKAVMSSLHYATNESGINDFDSLKKASAPRDGASLAPMSLQIREVALVLEPFALKKTLIETGLIMHTQVRTNNIQVTQ